ncbi:hypothetical protein [Polyangium aurulentum]|uniref:hypothetical protein n=1 Tax=Polyangium aurulentum TaxID=2567896 RepID=UPI0010AE9E0D|nr:hypothetical protein [Polyangium aurulentum]UQA55828.1 hypothetical protein E8A73_031430 [Polyangium aurulentum]
MTHGRLLALLLVALAAACASNVEVPSNSAASSGAGGAGGGCAGDPPICPPGCGTDVFDEPQCTAGEWVCPNDPVDPSNCHSDTCWEPPLPCEVCDGGGPACKPDAACTSGCYALSCATCEGAPGGTTVFGGCACACDEASNEYRCNLVPSCCNEDMQCGDESYVPCVEHVCKQPVAGGCWKDEECGMEMICVGAFVCPCGSDCDAPDVPGTCELIPTFAPAQ